MCRGTKKQLIADLNTRHNSKLNDAAVAVAEFYLFIYKEWQAQGDGDDPQEWALFEAYRKAKEQAEKPILLK